MSSLVALKMGLLKMNIDNWSTIERASGLLVFVVFPMGFGFMVASKIANKVDKKYLTPMTLSQSGKLEDEK